MTIYLNIGSNRGEREKNLTLAISRLTLALPGEIVVSATIETEPWGFLSDNPFLNVGVAIHLESPMTPLEILGVTRAVERSIDPAPHRDSSGSYIDRTIDIDIIAIDDIEMDTPELTLPHPRMHERDFVLIPMREIASDWLKRHNLA